MPPTITFTSRHILLAQQFHHPRHDGVVRARKDRKPDHLHVFLQRRVDNHLRRLPQASIDHFHARVAQRARDHFGAAVVAVQARLGHQHSNRSGHGLKVRRFLIGAEHRAERVADLAQRRIGASPRPECTASCFPCPRPRAAAHRATSAPAPLSRRCAQLPPASPPDAARPIRRSAAARSADLPTGTCSRPRRSARPLPLRAGSGSWPPRSPICGKPASIAANHAAHLVDAPDVIVRRLLPISSVSFSRK